MPILKWLTRSPRLRLSFKIDITTRLNLLLFSGLSGQVYDKQRWVTLLKET